MTENFLLECETHPCVFAWGQFVSFSSREVPPQLISSFFGLLSLVPRGGLSSSSSPVFETAACVMIMV